MSQQEHHHPVSPGEPVHGPGLRLSSQETTQHNTTETNPAGPDNARRGRANFIALWTASSAGYFAYWVMQVALSLFANQLTRSPLLVSGVTFALTAPSLVFGLFAGAFVDRYDRRFLLIAITTLRLMTFGLAWFAALAGYVSLPLLYGTAFILGVTQALGEPALDAVVPMLVPRQRLDRANTWLTGAQNVIELLAFPLGGVFASLSVALTLGIGEGCILAAMVAFVLLRGTFSPTREIKRHIVVEVFAGIRFLWDMPMLLVIGLMAGVINACWGAYLAILVLYAVAPGPIGLTAPGYGFLLMSSSVGGVIGTLLAIPVQRWFGRRWNIGFNILGNALLFAAPALSANVWIVGGAALLGSITGPLWTITAATLLGRAVPTGLQGRVNAAYRFFGNGLAAIGPLLGGLIAQVFGLQAAFASCACLTLLMVVPFFILVKEKDMQ